MKIHVYGGASDSVVEGAGLTEKVVLHLMREKLNNGHSLYMDNFYNGFSPASKLLANLTYCTGTVGKKRLYLPDDVKTAVLRKGEKIGRLQKA